MTFGSRELARWGSNPYHMELHAIRQITRILWLSCWQKLYLAADLPRFQHRVNGISSIIRWYKKVGMWCGSYLVTMVCMEYPRKQSNVQSRQKRPHLPKVILLDRSNSVDRSHIGLDTKNLQTQTSTFLNHLVRVVCVLRGHGVRLPLDIGGNILVDKLAVVFEEMSANGSVLFAQ